MDAFAFQAANFLVGNSFDVAAIEIGGGEIELQSNQDCVIATAGAGYSLSVYTWEFPLWDSFGTRRLDEPLEEKRFRHVGLSCGGRRF